MSNYYELLKSPKWQKRRLEILQQHNFACSKCKSEENFLNVHHKIYVKGRKPWEYSDHELTVLCEGCHELEHADKDTLNSILANLGNAGPLSVKGVNNFLYAFLNSYYFMEDKDIGTQCFFGVGEQPGINIDSEMYILGEFYAEMTQRFDTRMIDRLRQNNLSENDLKVIFNHIAIYNSNIFSKDDFNNLVKGMIE